MKKSRKKLFISLLVIVAVVAISAGYYTTRGDNKPAGPGEVTVERRTIVDKALAVGTIDPETEISVKSKVSGVVQKLYVDIGDYVRVGEPLLEVKPDPTPLELVEAKRDVEMKRIALETTEREMARMRELLSGKLISHKEYDATLQAYEEAKLRHNIAKERLALLEKGKVRIDATQIESVVKAPISGYVLEKRIEVGDPVVPLTTYQEGTVLITMADMNNLIFKGTVDEIDVGKLREGMEAEIDIGAIPGDDGIRGKLRKISLKARKEDNTTVFPVEVSLISKGSKILRAGYSANANIIIEKKDSVLSIPERVVILRNDSSFVRIPTVDGKGREIAIITGLSDAIHIEVVSGLQEGNAVLEKPVKEIQ